MAVRCLLVDDDRAFLRAARYLLERQGAEVVAVATTGAEARAHSHQLKPDVVLVDIELGAESGFDIARDLVIPGRSGDAPVILISSYSADDFADIVTDSPALGFLPKADLSESAIRRILTEGGGRSP